MVRKHKLKYTMCQMWGVTSIAVILILALSLAYVSVGGIKTSGSLSLDKDVVGKAIGAAFSCRDAAMARYENLRVHPAAPVCAASSCLEQCACDALDAKRSWQSLHSVPDTSPDDLIEELRQCDLQDLRSQLREAEDLSNDFLINITQEQIAANELSGARYAERAGEPIIASTYSPDAFYDAVYDACVQQDCSGIMQIPVMGTPLIDSEPYQPPVDHSDYVPSYDYNGPTIEGGN